MQSVNQKVLNHEGQQDIYKQRARPCLVGRFKKIFGYQIYARIVLIFLEDYDDNIYIYIYIYLFICYHPNPKQSEIRILVLQIVSLSY
jgi:hypothetical protein